MRVAIGWSKIYDCCINCDQIDSPHASKGVCGRCYMGIRNHGDNYRPRTASRWAVWYDHCVACKKNDYPHKLKGLCQNCSYKHYFKIKVREHRMKKRAELKKMKEK